VQPPPPVVALAFGVPAGVEPRLLSGGQGRAWRCGDLVVKPVDCVAEVEWVSEVLAGWPEDRSTRGVRVPRPVRAVDGSWVHRGWSAHWWLEGTDVSMPRDAGLVRKASDAFHEVTADLARPDFLDARSDPWSCGDRVAWEDAAPEGSEPIRRLVGEARGAYEPVSSPSQVIHGDIGGNVLAAPGLPPGVIDWPPYFRPAAFALAVAAVDALCWSGASPHLLDDWADLPEWRQLLLRAFVYRTATQGRFEAIGGKGTSGAEYAKRCRPCLAAILSRDD
jgi:uncharacterized protein (TIGR02569 family)